MTDEKKQGGRIKRRGRCTITFSAANEGGVGKTPTIRMMAETCLLHSVRWLGIECDAGNTAASSNIANGNPVFGMDQIYRGHAVRMPYRTVAGKQSDASMQAWGRKLEEYANSGEYDHILMDVAAAQTVDLMSLLDQLDTIGVLGRAGHLFRPIIPIQDAPDKFKSVDMWVGWLARNPQYRDYIEPYVVLNPYMGASANGFGNREEDPPAFVDVVDFPCWFEEGNKTREAALKAGFRELRMPILHPVHAYLDYRRSLEIDPQGGLLKWANTVSDADPQRWSKNKARQYIRDCDKILWPELFEPVPAASTVDPKDAKVGKMKAAS